ncbi:MAG: hypothetical protein JO216_10615 [Hyphomicrobiales bacterium]|nr:hypothetical protein [Hyphomicrobiales bacterium]
MTNRKSLADMCSSTVRILDPARPRFLFLISALSFAAVVPLLWAWYGLDNGMPYETAFVYTSQFSTHQGLIPFFQGFIYQADPLRKFTSFFYHTAYLLSIIFSREGDFVFYQVVWAFLWWARGMLMVLICNRLFTAPPLISYLVGLFSVLHASDYALNWVGQLNQFGFIFWMLCAFYSYLRSIAEPSFNGRHILWAMAAAIFVYLNLYSYESGLFITIAFPLFAAIILDKERSTIRRLVVPLVLYMFPVALFVSQNLVRYFGSRQWEQTYQAGVMRSDWQPSALVSDLLFDIGRSLEFWTWPAGFPEGDMQKILIAQAVLVVLICASVALIVMLCKGFADQSGNGWRAVTVMGALGLVLVVFSFPAYLVLRDARGLWRTQFLSGIGFAFCYGALAFAFYSAMRRTAVRWIAPALVAVTVGLFSVDASMARGAAHLMVWEKHKQIMAAILRAAPRVAPGTVIVLTGLPHQLDGFGDNMWYDLALRLAYPGTLVAGVYMFDQGMPAPGTNLTPDNDNIRWTRTGFPTEIASTPAGSLIAMHLQKDGSAQLLRAAEIPPPWSSLAEVYSPEARITCSKPDPIAWRRYIRNSWLDPEPSARCTPGP